MEGVMTSSTNDTSQHDSERSQQPQQSSQLESPLSNLVTHLDIAGDWQMFEDLHKPPLSPNELHQVTTSRLSVDTRQNGPDTQCHLDFRSPPPQSETMTSSTIDSSQFEAHQHLQREIQPTSSSAKCVTHSHIAGDWDMFLKQQDLPSSPYELDQVTTKQLFVDSFLDTPNRRLYHARVWLRKREYLDGVVEWSLKRNFVLDGNQIEYEETKGAEKILAILRHDFDLELFNEAHMDFALPVNLAWLHTIRVNIINRPGTYFDLVQYFTNCFATFITHTSPAPRSTAKPPPRLLSKVFIWSYFYDKKHFAMLQNELSIPSGEAFWSDIKPPSYFESSLKDLAASPMAQSQELDYDSLIPCIGPSESN